MTNLKNLTGKQNDNLMVSLKLSDKSSSDLGTSGKRRGDDDVQPKKFARGGGFGGGRGGGGRGGGGVKPLMSRGGRGGRVGFSTGAGPNAGMGFSMGADRYGADYGSMYGGPMGYSGGMRPMGMGYGGNQRMALIRAAARAALRGSRGGWM